MRMLGVGAVHAVQKEIAGFGLGRNLTVLLPREVYALNGTEGTAGEPSLRA